VVKNQLDGAIQQLLRKRMDIDTPQIPLLGLQIDVNDAGLIGGIFLSAILFILFASLRRETANLRIAIKRARGRQDLDLLAMAQVLSFVSAEKSSEHRAERLMLDWAVKVAITVPFIALFFLCFDDFRDIRQDESAQVGPALIGASKNMEELGFEGVAGLIAACLTIVCLKAKGRLNDEFLELETAIGAIKERSTPPSCYHLSRIVDKSYDGPPVTLKIQGDRFSVCGPVNCYGGSVPDHDSKAIYISGLSDAPTHPLPEQVGLENQLLAWLQNVMRKEKTDRVLIAQAGQLGLHFEPDSPPPSA